MAVQVPCLEPYEKEINGYETAMGGALCARGDHCRVSLCPSLVDSFPSIPSRGGEGKGTQGPGGGLSGPLWGTPHLRPDPP